MNQFNIITSANSELELLIKESLLIKTHKPTLNNMEPLNLKNNLVCPTFNDFLFRKNTCSFTISVTYLQWRGTS